MAARLRPSEEASADSAPLAGVQQLLERALAEHLREVRGVRQELRRAKAEAKRLSEAPGPGLRQALAATGEYEGQRDAQDDSVKTVPSNARDFALVSSVASGEGTASLVSSAGAGAHKPHFKFRKVWQQVAEEQSGGFAEHLFLTRPNDAWGRKTKRSFKGFIHAITQSFSARGTRSHSRFPSGFYIRPDCIERLVWDLTGLALIFYDFLAIPFIFCFSVNVDDIAFLAVAEWITLIFWTLDMLQGFILSYYDAGRLETNNLKILKHYITGWFTVDVFVVVPGWAMDLQSGAEVGLLAKILKSARAMRILRLVRLAKLQKIMHSLYDRVEDERKFITLNLIKFMFGILVMNHTIACFWYFIGTQSQSAGLPSWISIHLEKRDENLDPSLLDRYLVSLHWSLTQFTPAGMNVSATNELERAFSIIVLFFAMVCFSSIVGSITGAMTALRTVHADHNRQFWLLRRYLRQRKVDDELRGRICKFLEYQTVGRPHKVDQSQLPILKNLSHDLMAELLRCEYWDWVQPHPIFQILHGDEQAHVQRLCNRTVRHQTWAEQEVIYRTGDVGTCMYFFQNSVEMYSEKHPLEYRYGFSGDDVEGVLQGSWISEATIWCRWRHLGELRCNQLCDMIIVDEVEFAKGLQHHPRPWTLAQVYGLLFIQWLNSLEPGEPSDLLPDYCFHSFMLCAIEATVKGVADVCLHEGAFTEFQAVLETTEWFQTERQTIDRMSTHRHARPLVNVEKNLQPEVQDDSNVREDDDGPTLPI